MIDKRASDLHITAGVPPDAPGRRRHPAHEPRDDHPRGAANRSRTASSPTSSASASRTTKELDFSFGIKGLSRFRANVFQQRGVTCMAIRQIPFEILDFDKSGAAPRRRGVHEKHEGAHPGDGADRKRQVHDAGGMLDQINNDAAGHIITIEDPIEYIHQHKRCIVNQREVGRTRNRSRPRSSTSCGRTRTSS